MRDSLHFQQQDYDGVIECLSPSSDHWISACLPQPMLGKAACRAPKNVLRASSTCGSEQYVTPLAEAFAAIGMGDFDLAFQCLEEAIDHKTNFVNLLAVEPFFRSSPR